jgi:hypothetical protein
LKIQQNYALINIYLDVKADDGLNTNSIINANKFEYVKSDKSLG